MIIEVKDKQYNRITMYIFIPLLVNDSRLISFSDNWFFLIIIKQIIILRFIIISIILSTWSFWIKNFVINDVKDDNTKEIDWNKIII